MIRKNLGLLAIVGLFVFSVTYVYAYEELVDLPREDYQNKSCYAIIWNSEDWEYNCKWGYGELMVIAYPRDGIVIPIDPETPIEDVIKEIELKLAESLELDGTDDSVPDVEEEIPVNPIKELDPEVREALDKLGECQFGVGNWAAFVNEYSREVPDELPIFTSGLDRQRIINELARNFEECRGMTEYPWLSAQYENAYLADQLGLDLHGRGGDMRPGNEPSLMFEMTADVTEAEKIAEADRWATWMCADENLHLNLCGHEFDGINKGGYTEGADCQIDGQPASEGGSAAEERCPLRALEAHERNQPTTAEIFEAIQESICDEYLGQYEYLAIDLRPDWLAHCQ